ncbi:hypothetical protein TraAM80_09201 [Trypanosoma rangeli]|uniref:Uncharacterized protein n=1 Tax=Trypanosoma rangeli TaxID=5698 RepID=A0A422MWS1_TRYRA|nr:uncharacterized protein TraAM80_09201 [Trypanosoma rangeli]RNE97685.1 hypothetical protein TraAM80_09201 [Trypanosoma rangeli]|eukprot:RNE97685.1 hypothetical protein TraAM80_09201 [Trypanosoma rangeli]
MLSKWGDVIHSGAMVMPLPMLHLHRLHKLERVFVVYQNAKGEKPLFRASCAYPSYCSGTYEPPFHQQSTPVAVLYLGRKVVNGKKLGIEKDAVDMKIQDASPPGNRHVVTASTH